MLASTHDLLETLNRLSGKLFRKKWDQPANLEDLGLEHSFPVKHRRTGGRQALVPKATYAKIKVRLGSHGATDFGDHVKVITPGQLVFEAVSVEQAQKVVDQFRQTIKGGKGDKLDPSKFPIKTIAFGIDVELEHTPDMNKALDIVLDHLAEKPDYYAILDDAGLVDESAPTPASWDF